MVDEKYHIPAAVLALRRLLKNSIKTTETVGKSMDQLCFQFNVLKTGYGSNVVTAADYAAALGINYRTFAYHINMYNKRQRAALGELAGEKK